MCYSQAAVQRPEEGWMRVYHRHLSAEWDAVHSVELCLMAHSRPLTKTSPPTLKAGNHNHCHCRYNAI